MPEQVWTFLSVYLAKKKCGQCTLVNDVLLVSKILLGYEEALWPKKLEISHANQILRHEPQILVLS